MLALQTPLPAYTKTEVMVPMRDGTRLYTAIYRPVGVAEKLPVILERTPYGSGPYGPEKEPKGFAPTLAMQGEGYVFVNQDIRGRYMSEGTFLYGAPITSLKDPKTVDNVSDAYDTVEWLLKNQPGLNGRVGVVGISQPGQYATQALISGHPAIVCGSPQAPVTDRWRGDDDHRAGVLTLAQRLSFVRSFGLPTRNPTPAYDRKALPAGPTFEDLLKVGGPANLTGFLAPGQRYWDEIMAHPDDDSYWRARATDAFIGKTKAAVLVVGGFFDAEDLYGALRTYQAFRKANPRGEISLAMGPWSHGGWMGKGDRLGAWEGFGETGSAFRSEVMEPFFRRHLKETPPKERAARAFFTGSNRWWTGPVWPPRTRRSTVALRADGTLGVEPGPSGEASYRTDPNRPTPFMENPNGLAVPSAFMGQRTDWARRRSDLKVWTSEPLKDATSLAGPLSTDLEVAFSGADGDVVALLEDEDPTGVRRLVRWDVARARYRRSTARPTAVTPGRFESVSVRMQDVAHTFLPSHRIVLRLQSALFPLLERNPGTFIPVPTAPPEAFRPYDVKIKTGKGGSVLRFGTVNLVE